MSTGPKWITPAGSLGSFAQGKVLTIAVEAYGAEYFNIIAGYDPGYFVISNTVPAATANDVGRVEVTGSPYYFNENFTAEFVVRAYDANGGVSDRTFSLTITGPVDPIWITPEGYLQVGPNLEVYAFNKNRVDFLLQAEVAGRPQGFTVFNPYGTSPAPTLTKTKHFYIAENDGQLPPGLTLNPNTGLISGYINDQLTLDFLASKTGGYDGEYYDAYPYDHVLIINNQIEGRLSSITKIYTFYVTITDGLTSSKRKFQIRVEDPNTFRTDTTQITDDTTKYLADIGYLIPPIWLDTDNSILPNPSNLGTLRANNNQVIDLNAYDPYPFVGPVSFDWDIIKVNPEVRLLTDAEPNITGANTSNLSGQDHIIVSKSYGTPYVGMYMQLNTYVANASTVVYRINSVEQYGSTGYKLGLGLNTVYKGEVTTNQNFPSNNSPGDMYRVLADNNYYVCTGIPANFINIGGTAKGFIDYYLETTIPDITYVFIGSLSKHPPGLDLIPETGILYGRLPYQPAYSENYRFTVRITKTDQDNGTSVSNNHIFNLTLKGDIETTINWISDTVLGSLNPGHISDISVKAEHTAANLDITYSLSGGKLPPGLTLTPTGNITGVIPTNIQTNFDIAATGFDSTTFDNATTTFDRSYSFNITARDSYLFSAISKDFTIDIVENTIIPYTNIYVKPLLKRDQRTYFRSLIEDFTIFNPSLLYRYDDPNFGVQREVKMTIEYGIEKIDLDKYVPALTDYFKRRRYYFGELKSAVALDSNGNKIYDVVYVDIVDNQMIGNKISVARSFTQVVNGITVTYYPDSVLNEQYALSTIEITQGQSISLDKDLRPKFMQTLQIDTGVQLGFVKAFIICYTLPDQSSKIISSIKRSGFDFKLLDFDVDRLAIENTLDYVGTKYLVFGSTSGDTGFYINTEDDQDLLTEDSNPLLI